MNMLKVTRIFDCLPAFCSNYACCRSCCPVCSNPRPASSEKLEAGLDTLYSGVLRATLNLTNGFDYKEVHPNFKGLSPEGEVSVVPLHNHLVELDFCVRNCRSNIRSKELVGMAPHSPRRVKMQTASMEYLSRSRRSKQEAILRNQDIHHRNENYTGITDLRLLFAHRLNGFYLNPGGSTLPSGSSLPTGKTEENPLTAAAEGVSICTSSLARNIRTRCWNCIILPA